MRRLAVAAASLAAASVVAGLVLFALDPWQFSQSSVALIALGMLMSTLVVLSGFLLVHAPWGRWGLAAATGSAMLLASANPDAVVVGVLVAGAVAIVLLIGPWLRFWVRQQPAVDAPNHVAVALTAIAPVAPLVVGIGAYDTTHWTQWIAALAATGSSFAYAKAVPGAIWSLRIVVPITAAAAFAASPMPWVLTIGLTAAACTVAAWLPQARRTTAQPSSALPAPRAPRKEHGDATG